jgi:hypothetical protein
MRNLLEQAIDVLQRRGHRIEKAETLPAWPSLYIVDGGPELTEQQVISRAQKISAELVGWLASPIASTNRDQYEEQLAIQIYKKEAHLDPDDDNDFSAADFGWSKQDEQTQQFYRSIANYLFGWIAANPPPPD